ncbi:up-regulator of cell proliferation-like [Pelobates cultripes]|uniref:Up-regulator of cell proliferation-like n=1 Tax=Pelobates cultripes TaxID=61616 RepID=A0AAD1SWI1_PELCU|nr:up-regulator of cell proliferation-like [Pelobates cultripes]
MEDNVVNIPMLTFSFVRMGKTKLSKSYILNQVLSPAQQHHEFFIHYDMQGGNIERKIFDGLVEMSWYFPSGSEKSDIFPEPIAVANLRGDLQSNWTQFTFLTRVSSTVFIFTESTGEREFRMLSNCESKDTEYNFIITPSPGKDLTTETIQNLQKLASILKTGKSSIIVQKSTENKKSIVEQIQSRIDFSINNSLKRSIKNMAEAINVLGVRVDEMSEECLKAKEHAVKITKEIKQVIQYKRETMFLQRDLWKQISKTDKEMCRMRNQGAKNRVEYLKELEGQLTGLHEQYRYNLPSSIKLFIDALIHFTLKEKHYFFKWMILKLDSIARNNLSSLQTGSTLNIEHFLREMGQLYEAECALLREKRIHKLKIQFDRLPGIAADLLLDGFPLELIDGDASNIPLQWITDVLTELDTKTRGQCRMRVITVLGVQSTGKSTLLNTMFGLQFPVANRSCSRGAFMTLIKVKEDIWQELGCNFFLVIDTEGLKAPELSSLEDSYEHDNELATLVVGLSDITIINMAMENSSEIKDILQSVIHAFMKMEEIGKKTKCLFVHQNVNDMPAQEENMKHRQKLQDQLDEMTNRAAKMEKKYGITTFGEVMDYDIEKDHWYIPGFWLGVPPMAPVNAGYSEKVSALKKYLWNFIKKCVNKPLNTRENISYIYNLWNAVKHEKFIFSLRNNLVEEAYNKLSIDLNILDFINAVHSWVADTETLIKNQSADTLNVETFTSHKKNELAKLLCMEEMKISELLENYSQDKSKDVHLLEEYKKIFTKVKSLKNELERNAHNTINMALELKKGKLETLCIQSKYQKTIERKVRILLEKCKRKSYRLNETDLKFKFDDMWSEMISELQLEIFKIHDINQSMLKKLCDSMHWKESNIKSKLNSVISLEEYGLNDFLVTEMHETHSFSLLPKKSGKLFARQDNDHKIKPFADSLITMCDRYVTEKVNLTSGYNDTYCKELLEMIDSKLSGKYTKNVSLSPVFELDIKLHIFGRAFRGFQKLQDTLIQEDNNLKMLKPQYFTNFLSTYHKTTHNAFNDKELNIKTRWTLQK